MCGGLRDLPGLSGILVELVIHKAVVQLGHGTLRSLAVIEDIATLFLVDASSTVEQGALKA